MQDASHAKNGKILISTRVTPKLKKQIAQRARKENRSEASTIRVILANALANETVL